jgi:hypothetical protein
MVSTFRKNARVAALALMLGLSLMVLPHQALAGAQVPFRGSDVGGFQFPGLCADGALQVVIYGEGTATHLGRYTYAANECFNPINGVFVGVHTFTSANGDQLFGTYSGQVAPTADEDLVTYHELLLITGGSGRFAGASGMFEVNGLADLASLTYSQSLTGGLSSQGSLKG